MRNAALLRLAHVVAELPATARAALLARFGHAGVDVLAASLADADAIVARVESLSDEGLRALGSALSIDPAFLEIPSEERAAAVELIDAGLLFELPPKTGRPSVMIPLEVRAAVIEIFGGVEPPLAVLLAAREPDELAGLADFHGLDADGDAVDLAIRVAETLLDIERLHGIFESLQRGARLLLEWLIEADGAVPEGLVQRRARDEDGGAAALVVLERIGIVQRMEIGGDALVSVPLDAREAVRPILETQMSEACREWYSALRDHAVPAFRDQFPSGVGGAVRDAAMYRLLRAQLGGADESDGFDRLLTVLRIIDPQDGVGELASVHLDVATSDAFARQAIRSWLGSLDDDFTRVLLDPFDGDPTTVADWILEQEQRDDAAFDPLSDREAWTTLLVQLRAQLVMALGLLPAGHWFRLDDLTQWFCAVYRRIVWHYGAFASYGDAFPRHALPMPGVDLQPTVLPAVQESLFRLMAEFLMPIGAVQLDATGTLFLVNSEALRVFRDGDDGFDLLWAEAEDYAGDDIDLWMPIPTDPGTRVHGVSWFMWANESALVPMPPCHTSDLVRLTSWATPVHDGVGVVFHFDAESVGRGLEAGNDADEFLLWTRCRAGRAMPGALRALFPVSSSAADRDDEWYAAAAHVVLELVEQLESWHEQPPGPLMEEIRSWGDVAAHVLIPRAEEWIAAESWDHPTLRHACLLLGDLGIAEAADVLTDGVIRSPNELLEAAAAMAVARIGAPAMDPMISLLDDTSADPEKRIVAAGTLSSLAVLHPTQCFRAVSSMKRALPTFEQADLVTLLGINIAETGHPDGDDVLYALRDEGDWVEEMMPFDEALWIASLSPAVWGHPFFAAPLAHLYPTASEGARISERAGVGDLASESGVSEESLLGRTSHAPRRKKNRDEP